MESLQLVPDRFIRHCPFNNSHTMPVKTLIKHLIRCPDRPPNYKDCSYNKSHVVPKAELQSHEENCPDRILFDNTIYESEDMIRPVPVIYNTPKLVYEEVWDGLEQTSDVLRNIKRSTIGMKAKHGSTKSERKLHRVLLHHHDNAVNNEKSENKGNNQQKSEPEGKKQQKSISKVINQQKSEHNMKNQQKSEHNGKNQQKSEHNGKIQQKSEHNGKNEQKIKNKEVIEEKSQGKALFIGRRPHAN